MSRVRRVQFSNNSTHPSTTRYNSRSGSTEIPMYRYLPMWIRVGILYYYLPRTIPSTIRSSIAAGPARVGGRADPISRPTNVTTSHHYRVTHPPDPPTRAPVSAPDDQQQPAHRDQSTRARPTQARVFPM